MFDAKIAAQFLDGLALGLRLAGSAHPTGLTHVQRQGFRVARDFLADVPTGNAPGLTLGDYVDAALEDLGASQPDGPGE